jgi:hypothetical protein
MRINLHVRTLHDDLFAHMDDPAMDMVAYSGHSELGKEVLSSLESAPPQHGAKVLALDSCMNIDTFAAVESKLPEAASNSVHTLDSALYDTGRNRRVGKYSTESEGVDMLRVLLRGMMKKQDWRIISRNLGRYATWDGHPRDRLWLCPGNRLLDRFSNADTDGIPDLFDVVPDYGTFDVHASTRREFDLCAPDVPSDQLNGTRVFDAVQFLNTAAEYHGVFARVDPDRRVFTNPRGAFFDASEDRRCYVRFSRSGHHIYAQFSSALAGMSRDSLRAVLCFAFARWVAQTEPRRFSNRAEAIAAAAAFATASLVYSPGRRKRAILAGLRRLFALPSCLRYEVLTASLRNSDRREHWAGDRVAAAALAHRFPSALIQPGVGEPAVDAR